jgi:hypothetical protein
MLIPISHLTWQQLRFLLRAEATGEYPIGRELRLKLTRRTKNGMFLDDLVAAGLIEVSADAAPRPSGGEGEPRQFRTRYRLTNLGRQAAEYGEYDGPCVPGITGLARLAARLASQKGEA